MPRLFHISLASDANGDESDDDVDVSYEDDSHVDIHMKMIVMLMLT